ncbi:MAG: T9SS type A sorting domain-containing protein [Saprospiraceae bacterium]|nr:T9SS type A sorting domain-containing protein [Saprospiraceae bacterium]
MNTQNLKYYLTLILIVFAIIGKSQPLNDSCINAITLTNLNAYCSDTAEFTNINATTDTIGIASCWNGNTSGRDVWFKFTAIASGVNITVSGLGTNLGTVDYPQIGLYTGSCSALTEIGCGQASYIHGFANSFITGLNIGQTYYIRIGDTYNFPGTFQLCVNNFTPPVIPGNDCVTASYLCNKNAITKDTVNGSGAIQEGFGTCIDISYYSNPERNSAWYTWEAANNGILTFTIMPNFPDDDIDFVVYELINGDCNNKKILRCEASGGYGCHGATGLNMTSTDTVENAGCLSPNDNFVKYLTLETGKTYALLVNNWTMSNVGFNNGFNLIFGGNAEFKGPKSDFFINTSSTCFKDNSFTFVENTSQAESFLWDFGADASISTDTTEGPHTVTYSTPGVKYIVLKVTGQGGCDVVHYKVLYISDRSVDLGNDTTICYYDSLQLNAGTAFNSYLWSDSSNAQTYDINFSKSGEGLKTYNVKVKDGGCITTDTINVTISKPTVELGTDTSFCVYDTLILDAGEGDYIYNWSIGENTRRIMVDTSIIQGGSAKLQIIITDTIGCISSDSINISTKKRPIVELGSDTILCNTNSLILDAGSDAQNYLWSNKETSQSFVIDYIGAPGTTANYSVIAEKEGCLNYDTISISFIDCSKIIKAYDIFPNPSSGNFIITLNGYESMILTITNSHGQLIMKEELQNNSEENFTKEFVLPHLSSGLYFLELRNSDVNIVEKLLVY